MGKNKKNKHKAGGKKEKPLISKNPFQVDPNSIGYEGPIITKKDKEQIDTYVVLLKLVSNLSSSGGSQITQTFSSNPASAGDWSSLAAVWEEYRILGMRVKFRPDNRYSKTTTICRPGYAVVDRGSSAALGSIQAAANHESAKEVDLEDPWSIEAKMNNADEASFISTASPQAFIWIKLWFEGLTASTEYGIIETAWRVQFRGRA